MIAPALQSFTDEKKSLAPTPDVRFLKILYLAPPEGILALLRALPNATESLLIIGHNPGIQALAITLAGNGAATGDAPLYRDFPPTTLAVLNLEIATWKEIAKGCGKLLEVAIPDQDKTD